MILDHEYLRTEGDGHEARRMSPAWTIEEGEKPGAWMDWLAAKSKPGASVAEQRTSRSVAPSAVQQRAARPHQKQVWDEPQEQPVESTLRSMDAITGVPDWLVSASGNPSTYDAPNPIRIGVCVRLLPASYSQIKQVKYHHALRTVAGTMEFLLRLGLAVAERMPRR